MGCTFVVFASHQINLEVKYIITEQRPLIVDIRPIMSKLCFPVRLPKPKKQTDLISVKRNKTRWSCVKEMLERHIKIREYQSSLKISEVDERLPSRCPDQNIKTLIKSESALYHQCEAALKNAAALQSLEFFNNVNDRFPELKHFFVPILTL